MTPATSGKLQTLTYVSTATRIHDVTSLISIMHESRSNNGDHGITGILLYNEGTFMQTIEGREQDISSLYNNLLKDERHHSLIKLLHEDISARQFSKWLISFRAQGIDLEGYSSFLNDPDSELLDSGLPSHAKALLESFRKSIR